jgi:hypothetical protein
VTYVSLNYSRIVDSLNLRIGAAHADLKFKVDKGPVEVLYRCTNDPEICGKKYSSLDAMRLMVGPGRKRSIHHRVGESFENAKHHRVGK